MTTDRDNRPNGGDVTAEATARSYTQAQLDEAMRSAYLRALEDVEMQLRNMRQE